jgi:hypothetical protein
VRATAAIFILAGIVAKRKSALLSEFDDIVKSSPYAGKKDNAAKELAKAVSLDLTAAKKFELAGMTRG